MSKTKIIFSILASICVLSLSHSAHAVTQPASVATQPTDYQNTLHNGGDDYVPEDSAISLTVTDGDLKKLYPTDAKKITDESLAEYKQNQHESIVLMTKLLHEQCSNDKNWQDKVLSTASALPLNIISVDNLLKLGKLSPSTSPADIAKALELQSGTTDTLNTSYAVSYLLLNRGPAIDQPCLTADQASKEKSPMNLLHQGSASAQ